MRGEYGYQWYYSHGERELPPRARRIPDRVSLKRGEKGNYLRVRGEYRFYQRFYPPRGELPPRARRIPKRSEVAVPENGTTSACAENTRCQMLLVPCSGNYLRVRGEYPEQDSIPAHWWELPPRARRIPSPDGVPQSPFGTTSACAENTLNELGLL